MAVDELVERIVPLRGRPMWTHLYLTPFFVAYAVWLTVWLGWIGAEHWELGLIVSAVLALSQRIVPLRGRPMWTHLYLTPFFVAYAVWLTVWLGWIGAEHWELGLIVSAVLALSQVLALLACHWSVGVRAFASCSPARSALEAGFVRVDPTPNNGSAEIVPLMRTRSSEDGPTKLWFEFQKVHYSYDAEERKEFRAAEFPVSEPFRHYQEAKGLEDDDVLRTAQDKFGANRMDIHPPQFAELFKERATAPFFVFQVFCVGLWCLDEYWYYSVFTLMMLVTFEATLVKQQLKNLEEIRNMGNKPFPVQVYRKKRWGKISSAELVAGDIVSVGRSSPDDPKPVPCDLLLLRGPCIVDESMLTGESVPQMKEPLEEADPERVLDLESDGRLHLLSGGTRIVQHTPPPKTGPGLKAPDGGCVAYVLRTGFDTNQGRLLRTIIFSAKRVTANNAEAFGFILFLLIFAIAAASYVWTKGIQDPNRSRYKLFLECTLILTSVVPPELPIELSLAVNSSLVALQKLGVFCTEPFRIPFAGKVGICCFDKTGTLTTDKLVVEGVAGLPGTSGVSPVSEAPSGTVWALATCHSLVQMDDELVGDPMEKACLGAAQWTLTKNDSVIPKKGKDLPLKIFARHHFSSALKRMSVVAGYMPAGTSDVHHIATVKGAPETLKAMFKEAPADYDQTYEGLTREGYRVLALGTKALGQLTHQQVRETKRAALECELSFAGFVAISCPLKADTKAVIKEIAASSHRVVMITGDNALTACHVAKELRMTGKRKQTMILEPPLDGVEKHWQWVSVDRSLFVAMNPERRDFVFHFITEHELCLTGPGLTHLAATDPEFLQWILPLTAVFARMAPKQKEKIITDLKAAGHLTLMCGDGTNDVGALKQAHVGVALLANPVPDSKEARREARRLADSSPAHTPSSASSASTASSRTPTSAADRRPRGAPGRRVPGDDGIRAPAKTPTQKRLEELMREMEEEERASVVRLGDASYAAPFTSKYSSVQSICHVIKQGRCTLVTTLQMFKILALNALVLAYSQSVLYLEGVKFSDTQATVQGLLLALCFLFISRSKPLKTLSRQRPLPTIFNFYTLATVSCQFAVHFSALLFLVREAYARSPERPEFPDLEKAFEPNLVNSTVYIMSMALQVCTFAVNYRGHPFMESLLENKTLLYSIMGSGGAVLALASGLFPDLSEYFQLVPFEAEFRNLVCMVLAADLLGCAALDSTLAFLFGDVRLPKD